MDRDKEHLNSLSSTMRLYADMRFKQLTLFLAWHTIAGAGIVNYGTDNFVGCFSVRIIIALASIFVIAVIWVMEYSATLFWDRIQKEAPEIWPVPDNRFLKIVNASTVVFTLYTATYLFWRWLSIQWGFNPWISGLLILIGVTFFLFGAISYFHLRHRKQSNKK
jgi:hypothetical protein